MHKYQNTHKYTQRYTQIFVPICTNTPRDNMNKHTLTQRHIHMHAKKKTNSQTVQILTTQAKNNNNFFPWISHGFSADKKGKLICTLFRFFTFLLVSPTAVSRMQCVRVYICICAHTACALMCTHLCFYVCSVC